MMPDESGCGWCPTIPALPPDSPQERPPAVGAVVTPEVPQNGFERARRDAIREAREFIEQAKRKKANK
jgi:hypothetical protein